LFTSLVASLLQRRSIIKSAMAYRSPFTVSLSGRLLSIQQTEAELLGGEKLPKMDVLKEKRRQLAARKKALYLEYRKAQQDMRELVAVKGSVDHLRGLTDNHRNKEQAR